MPRLEPRLTISHYSAIIRRLLMPFKLGTILRILPVLALFLTALAAHAQSGNASAVRGSVTDPSGAVVPNATVTLDNARSGLLRTLQTDTTGQFVFSNVPFNSYRISIAANGFVPLIKDFELRSVVGTSFKLTLQVAAASQTVTVEASGDLVETDPTFHSDVDRDLFIKVPLESASSTLSSLVTLSTRSEERRVGKECRSRWS